MRTLKNLSSISRYMLYALLIFTPLARGSVQGWAVCVIYLATLLALGIFLAGRSLVWEWEWIATPMDRPFLAMLLLCLISSVFSVHRQTSLWAMVTLINYVVVFYLTIHTIRTRTRFKQLIYLIIGMAILLSVLGLFKKFTINPFPWWDYEDLKYPLDFISSTYGNHNHFAGYLEMAIPIAIGLMMTGVKGINLFLLICLLPVMLTAQTLSLSRGGWASTMLGLCFMAVILLKRRYFKHKGFLITGIAGAVFTALILLGSTPVVERGMTIMQQEEENSSLHSRAIIWSGTIKMIGDYPLLGTGPGTFSAIFTQYQPPGFLSRFIFAHNDYLHFVAEAGLLLIAVIIWMIIALYKKGFKKMENPSRLVRGITVGGLSGITAILVHSISDFNLHIPANALLFTVLAAIVAAPVPLDNIS